MQVCFKCRIFVPSKVIRNGTDFHMTNKMKLRLYTTFQINKNLSWERKVDNIRYTIYSFGNFKSLKYKCNVNNNNYLIIIFISLLGERRHHWIFLDCVMDMWFAFVEFTTSGIFCDEYHYLGISWIVDRLYVCLCSIHKRTPWKDILTSFAYTCIWYLIV